MQQGANWRRAAAAAARAAAARAQRPAAGRVTVSGSFLMKYDVACRPQRRLAPAYSLRPTQTKPPPASLRPPSPPLLHPSCLPSFPSLPTLPSSPLSPFLDPLIPPIPRFLSLSSIPPFLPYFIPLPPPTFPLLPPRSTHSRLSFRPSHTRGGEDRVEFSFIIRLTLSSFFPWPHLLYPKYRVRVNQGHPIFTHQEASPCPT